MAASIVVLNNILLSITLLVIMCTLSGEAIKCFDCNSQNNSACLDLHLQKMHAIIPITDCNRLQGNGNGIKREFFCRKITQTILHVDKTPEVRITRGCGWIKHKRECYKADNQDHLETVCQCFGDMCNAAAAFENVKMTVLTAVIGLFTAFKTWRGHV